MHFSKISALFSLSAVALASAIPMSDITTIEARNDNHVSWYEEPGCPKDSKTKHKWKGTDTCNCISISTTEASIYTDHEPLQHVAAFSDGNCQKPLGILAAKTCYATVGTFNDEAISSVVFWLPGVCDAVEIFKEAVGEIEHLLALAEAAG